MSSSPFTCIAIQRRNNALAVIPSRPAWSRILACCSSVKVNERGAVFTPVFVCSRIVGRGCDIIYYLRHAPRFPGGKRHVPNCLTASQRPCEGCRIDKSGGGFASSRRPATVRGGEAPNSLFAAAFGHRRQEWQGLGILQKPIFVAEHHESCPSDANVH